MTPAQAESAALQAVTAFPHLIAQVGLEPEDFADARRRAYFESLKETRHFLSSGAASALEVGTRAGLERQWIASEFTLAFSLEVQAKDLVRKLREIAVGERCAGRVREIVGKLRGQDLIEAISACGRQFTEMCAGGSDISDMETVVVAHLDRVEAQIRAGKPAMGLSTGLPTLDKVTKGFRGGELWAVVALGGAGKSTLLEWWRRNLAQAMVYSLLFSGEMTEEQQGERAAHAECAIPLSEDLNDLRAIQDARDRIMSTAIYRYMGLDTRSRIVPSRVRSVIRSKKAEHGSVGLVGLDHLRHIDIVIGRGGSAGFGDVEFVSKAAAEAKQIAKDELVPTVLLCHGTREGERMESSEGKPNRSIIKGGTAILDTADVCLCLWRSRNNGTTIHVWKARQTTGMRDIEIPIEFHSLTQSFSEQR